MTNEKSFQALYNEAAHHLTMSAIDAQKAGLAFGWNSPQFKTEAEERRRCQIHFEVAAQCRHLV